MWTIRVWSNCWMVAALYLSGGTHSHMCALIIAWEGIRGITIFLTPRLIHFRVLHFSLDLIFTQCVITPFVIHTPLPISAFCCILRSCFFFLKKNQACRFPCLFSYIWQPPPLLRRRCRSTTRREGKSAPKWILYQKLRPLETIFVILAKAYNFPKLFWRQKILRRRF